MRSLQDYRNTYRAIATKLNLEGDSVELLVQLLAQASYIEEVENISYARESSIEKATLTNSKIQHCMNNMYSVYRGACPRVIMKFKAKNYLSFELFDEIVSSNNFKVYYLGYYDPSDENNKNVVSTDRIATEEGFHYGPVSVVPDGEDVVIIGLLAKETVVENWQISSSSVYVESFEENLSNDMYLYSDDRGYLETTRDFSEHVLNDKVFDLTTTSYGSRLYIPNLESAEYISALYFKYSKLNEYNNSELKRINIKETEPTTFNDDDRWSAWLGERGYSLEEFTTGLILLDARGKDTDNTIHYKASKERYVTSIIRSNSDIGRVLEESFPEKVRSGGTTYKFLNSGDSRNLLTIYYVPQDRNNPLTYAEIDDFVNTKKAYYITDSIKVEEGNSCDVVFSLDLDLYQNSSVDTEVEEILNNYSYRFNIDLREGSDYYEEIKTLIGKISNIAKISDMSISGLDSLSDSDIATTYYNISFNINSKVISNI